jgi:hypothetical protein
MKPGDKAMVRGLHCAMEKGVTVRVPGEEHEATLVSPVGNENSRVWMVLFPGETATRCREVTT